jgi:nicotinate-nucleotide pyrophosphorylase (carboxylating)
VYKNGEIMLSREYIENIVKISLAEDINYIDVTTDNLIDENAETEAFMRAKADGILCGMGFVTAVFGHLGGVEILFAENDGKEITKGDIVFKAKGKTKSLLKGERTALNILQHMSGIATYTNKCVKAVEGTNVSIADTRKTLPGLRVLQKYAVTVGGGKNHRFNLSDAAMLKDNHIAAFGGITPAVAALRAKIGHTVKIEVEVSDFNGLREALDSKVDIIMLDNMDIPTMAEAAKIANRQALLEASGNITLENIRSVAQTGIDIISLGALTHSVKAFDISMIFV